MTQRKTTKESGFTLVEISIVIIIIGLATAAIITLVEPMMQLSRKKATEANMNRIIDVVSVYAQRNLRVPCPADPDPAATEPFGAETGSGSAGADIGDCDAPGDMVEGIVPFRTLGLTVDDVYDGWGNFITYAVSPVFADDTADSGLEAHERCRIADVWVADGVNRHPMKARFCCPDDTVAISSDLAIQDENGDDLWPLTRTNSDFDDVGVAYYTSGSTFDIVNDNVTAPSFLIVSHGPNEYGAYIRGGARKGGNAALTGDGEDENQNGDNLFVSTRPNHSRDGSDNFDDIVMWRTQDQLFAETGVGSCVVP